jgi:multidrug efflux pump subunit AcrA (membrane-fusion protein)
MMQKNIFRQQAFNRLARPDQLDKLLYVTSPRGWIALAGLFLIVVSAVVWGIFGTIPRLLPASGILVRENGVSVVAAESDGQVAQVYVRVGETVTKGQRLALFRTADGREQVIVSNLTGNVLEALSVSDATVKSGTTLVSLEATDQPLQAILLVPVSAGKSLKTGMRVQVSPTSVSTQEHGYMLGTIRQISPLPASQTSLQAEFKNPVLAQMLLQAAGPGLQVWVTLETEPNAPAGWYKWSSGSPPPVVLSTGTLCQAQIVVEQQRPISLVLPVLQNEP